MNCQQTGQIITASARQTRLLGRHIGARLPAGTVIKLTGALGSGKTCFVQGLAQGLEVPEGYDITSPTYALIHEYPGRMPLVHVDLYRIANEMDAEAIGLWDLIDPRNVVVVEWADRIEDGLWPPESMTIEFQTLADETRGIHLFGYGLQFGNLIKEVLALWDAGGNSPSRS
jgi:tRNA threonylcarbamoyladenosine biosynthesis protein TsaE